MLRRLSFVTSLIALLGCDVADVPRTRAAPEPARTAATAPRPQVTAPQRVAQPVAPAAAPTSSDIHWSTNVHWRGWSEGIAEARREKKGICLVVYADWCPKCKLLAPVFDDPDVARLTKEIVLIRQDADDRPDWLGEKFDALGSYVPRVFFLDHDGKVRAEITSGDSRYPYFYTPQSVDRLKLGLKLAAAG